MTTADAPKRGYPAAASAPVRGGRPDLATPYLLVLALCGVYALTHTTQFNGDRLAEVANVVQNGGHPQIAPCDALYFPFLGLLAGGRPVTDALGYIRLLQTVNSALAGIALLLVFRSQFSLIGLADRGATPHDTGPAGSGWMQGVTQLPPHTIPDHAGPVRWADGRKTFWEYRGAP